MLSRRERAFLQSCAEATERGSWADGLKTPLLLVRLSERDGFVEWNEYHLGYRITDAGRKALEE